MQKIASILTVVLCAGALSGAPVAGQPRRELHGRLFWVGDDGARSPASDVELVSQSGESVTSGDGGSFRLPLGPLFQAGETIAVRVVQDGWYVGRPLDGQLRLPERPDEVVEVELYREGSELFWSDERIEKFLVETAELSKEWIDRSGATAEIRLDFYVKRWARRHGWSVDKARIEVDRWLERSGDRSVGAERRGLAAFARSDLARAVAEFRRVAEQREKRLAELRRASESPGEEKRRVREVVRAWRLLSDAHFVANQLEEALAACERALAHVSRQATPQLWAATMADAGIVRLTLALSLMDPAALGERQRHLNACLDICQDVLQVITRELFPDRWAAIQTQLGRTLAALGPLSDGPDAVRKFEQAIAALRAALEVRTRREVPHLWAATMFHLTQPLIQLGALRPGAAGVPWLAEAVAVFRQILEVRTYEEVPQLWLGAQNNLANILGDLGKRIPGPVGDRRIEEALDVFRAVMEKQGPATTRDEWILLYTNLAWFLRERGLRAGAGGGSWHAESAEFFRRALALVDRAAEPVRWALMQEHLGVSLREEAGCAEGEERGRLLSEAAEGFERSAEICAVERAEWWVVVRHDLATTLQLAGRYHEAVSVLREVLAKEPDYREALYRLRWLWQDYLYEFEQAFLVTEEWTGRHPGDLLGQIYLTENLFTTERFEGCYQHALWMEGEPSVQDSEQVVLRGYEIAALRASGRPGSEISARLRQLVAMIAGLPEDFTTGWSFRGTEQFIRETPRLRSDRAWLLRLFAALRAPGRDAMVQGLRRLDLELDAILS